MTVPMKRDVKGARLPVRRLDELTAEVRAIAEVERSVNSALDPLCPPPADLPDLPRSTAETIAALRPLMAELRPPAILDCFSLLSAEYGARGDAEVRGDMWVEFLLAEKAPTIALYKATVRLLRPVPGEEAGQANGWVTVPPKARVFHPTLSEIIIAVTAESERWRSWWERIENLPERHAAARKRLG